MVAHVLRLRLALVAGALRGERLVRSVLAVLVTAAITVAVCLAVLGLGSAPLPTARAIIVFSAAAAFLAFFLGPMLTGTQDQLDPRRFAPFGVDEKRMPWILALASLVSVPSAALLVVHAFFVTVSITVGRIAWPVAVLAGLVSVISTACADIAHFDASTLSPPAPRSTIGTSGSFFAISSWSSFTSTVTTSTPEASTPSGGSIGTSVGVLRNQSTSSPTVLPVQVARSLRLGP